jgi:WD40 repeat protein
VALSPDARWLATGDEKGRLRLWDLRTGEQMGDRDVYGAVVSALAFSPDGRHLAVLLSDERLLVVRIDEPESE